MQISFIDVENFYLDRNYSNIQKFFFISVKWNKIKQNVIFMVCYIAELDTWRGFVKGEPSMMISLTVLYNWSRWKYILRDGLLFQWEILFDLR